jgi:hypothetical protein
VATNASWMRGVRWIVAGGLAYWLPVVLVSAVYRESLSVVTINVASVAGLLILGVTTWARGKPAPRWGWALVGIYILGPSAMLLAASFGRGPSPPDLPGDWLWMVLVCALPPMTLWLATLDGMIFSVLFVSVALPILDGLGHRRKPS